MTSKKDLPERDICTKYIQPALEKAGWNPLTQIREEVSFCRKRFLKQRSSPNNQTKGYEHMTDNIISFEEFRLEKKKAESENDPIMQVLKKDLREQEDLVDWYLFHSSFNKYKLFLHSLFYNNHERLKGSNPNAGFIQIFNESQINSISSRTEEALKWLNRRYILIDCKNKTIKGIGANLPYEKCNSFYDFFRSLQYYLLETDHVLVFKELSKSKITRNKSDLILKIG